MFLSQAIHYANVTTWQKKDKGYAMLCHVFAANAPEGRSLRDGIARQGKALFSPFTGGDVTQRKTPRHEGKGFRKASRQKFYSVLLMEIETRNLYVIVILSIAQMV